MRKIPIALRSCLGYNAGMEVNAKSLFEMYQKAKEAEIIILMRQFSLTRHQALDVLDERDRLVYPHRRCDPLPRDAKN